MGSSGGSDDPIYHYHSNFDSYHWMANFGDPGFKTHVVMGQYLGLLAYHLASEDLIPFDVTNYGVQMTAYLDELRSVIASSSMPDLDLTKIEDAIDTFNTTSSAAMELKAQAQGSSDQAFIDFVNAKFRDFERGFVSQGGLPDRQFYKHVVFAPGLDTGYAPTTFPGVTEAITMQDDRQIAEEWIEKTSYAILVAAGILQP